MKRQWFTRKNIFYIPARIPGWIIFSLALGCSVWVFIDIDSRSHSVSDTLINFVFNALLIALAYSLIGFFTEKISAEERRQEIK